MHGLALESAIGTLLPRLQLVELEDLAWFPAIVRDYATDYLEFIETALRVHEPIVPLLCELLETSGVGQVVDLCSGGGGPTLAIASALVARESSVRFTLTDRYPNRAAFSRAAKLSNGSIRGHDAPVDARSVPRELGGLRTVFNAFHHFAPDDARAVIADAVAAGQPIAIFEIPQRSVRVVLQTTLAPLGVMACTPFIRPFRWRRLLLTYPLPLVPLTCLWDGIVSQLRAYTAQELAALAREAGGEGYAWRSGTVPIRSLPLEVTYLLGSPPRT